ncbi:tetratricopeptide repeat protein [Gracilimonas sp.]|uniref:tetratricopeptide repeat protein n=1 Tax=Gracilimonas sp. TaxID=1974203 RepID=UPI0028713F59|nr:tetratricopeptide repeat protein [Gracilimonas sp.]
MNIKRLPLLLVAVLLSSSSIFAFQNEQAKPDTTLIKLMLQEAYQAEEQGNVEKAKRLANTADSLSQRIDFEEGLAYATLRKGTVLAMEQKFDAALAMLNNGIEKYPGTLAVPDLHVAIGNIQRTLGNCEESIRSFEEALQVSDLFKGLKKEEFKAGVNMNIGGCMEILGDYAGAIEKHLAALEYAQANADTSLMALSQMNIGNVYDEQQDIEKAGYYYERAIENATSINMGRALPGLYNNLALIRDQQERFEEAENLYLNAIKTQREMSNGTPFVQSIHNLGTLYRKMGEYDKSEEYLRRGLSLSKKMNIAVGLYYGNIEMGYLFQAREIYETAIQYFENARQIASDLENDTFLSEVN